MYKSLEHIIREIKEGKCECEKKKDSLEHAIKKVVKKEYESSYAARDSKPVDEGTDHSVYHVSWGPGLDHEVVARHGEEAVSKAKDALVAKTPKLKDPKYSDTFNKKPTVHNISKERNIQKEDVGGLAGSGTGGEPKLHAESGKKKKQTDEEDIKLPRDYGESIEEMNVVTNTGAEMMGRQFNTRSPLIGPPDVSQNSKGRQAAKNLTVQRMAKIQKFSDKNVSDGGKIGEEVVNEQAAVDLLKLFGPKVLQRLGPKAGALPKIKPVEPEPILPEPPAIEPIKPGKDVPRPDQIPANEPGPAPAKPEPKPEAPAKPAPKQVPAPAPATEPAPKTKPKTAPSPAPAPSTAPEPVRDPLAVPTPKAKPAPAPAPETAPAPKPAIPLPHAPAAEPVPAPAPAPKTAAPTVKGPKLRFPFGGVYVPKEVKLTGEHAPVSTSVSKARVHKAVKNVYKEEIERKFIKDMPRKDSGDRHDIEYVGRKDADPKSTSEKTSRQAQYKIKVIDEAKKLANVVKRVRKESGEGKTVVYDNVVINPDLNRPDNKNDADLKP